MKPEADIAFALLRAALTGEAPRIEEMETSRWWSLFRLLQQNHVAALCYTTVAAAGVPRDVLMPWLAEHEKATAWHRYQQEVQQEIVDTMHQHQIEALVLKGTHTAQYYPRPEEREFGDLDLYFYHRHSEADEVAKHYLGVAVSDKAHHHTKYDYRGVTVESHYDLLNIHYPPSNRNYEKMLKQLAPSPTFEVLFLLRHMAVHFASARITLRDLVDWTLTCRALKDTADWKLVRQTVVDYGMKPFVSALGTIVEQRLGYVLPLTFPEGTDTRISAAVERDVVYGSGHSSHACDGLGRLVWKLSRWRALAWKRRMVYNDSECRLLLASLTSHAEKPRSILHKM